MLKPGINCDLGEGMPNDRLLMPLINYANIACGGHAGNEESVKKTIGLAKQYNVFVGAHPSFPDVENFGRRDLFDSINHDVLRESLCKQISLVHYNCSISGIQMHHVKPHGGLYNRAAVDRRLSELIFDVIEQFNPLPVLFGLSGSEQADWAGERGIKFFHEVFADRSYQDDGTLTPRREPGSLLTNSASVRRQVQQLLEHGTVTALSGTIIKVKAETICIHGDGEHAVEFAKGLRSLQV
ncbi:MAG: 5-oxoprolinase subunit PxpA [Chitinophagaceae bacterium]|nr:5-oxoprolinase subunit PxpA [Chitinophagaceae bacterium]